MKLAGKTAVVTGGGTGIGAAVTQSLLAAGMQVAIGGRRLSKLTEFAESLQQPQGLLVHPLDVADRPSVDAFFSAVEGRFGAVDVLVNAAGVNIARRMFDELSPEDWDRLMAINCTGVFNCLKRALPGMRARRDGVVVNISSISGKRAYSLGGMAYNASKFGATGLGMSLGDEIRLDGIRMCNLYPGEVETPILEHRPKAPTAEHRATMLQPQDVADAVLMVVQLPPRARVPELVIVPTVQTFV